MTEPSPPRATYPRQIPYIIGNEACERFSFYGMRNVLTQFLVSSVILAAVETKAREIEAKEIFHILVMGVYFFPLLGGALADRVWGKYKTIFWLSLVYCVGNACLALFIDNRAGFFTGLLLISLGSGGIKPCVSAFVGEQFDQTNKHLAKRVFDAFYWIINFGSFFASALIPLVLKSPEWGARWAFGIPGILMAVATIIFWLGRGRYVIEPPSQSDPHSFFRVCWSALSTQEPGKGRPGLVLFGVAVAAVMLTLTRLFFIESIIEAVPPLCFALVMFIAIASPGVWLQLDRAKKHHPEADVEAARPVFRLLIIFALITPFWSLFDQKASTWVIQAGGMTLPGWSWFQSPSQMQALNPLLVMMLIPLNNALVFPLFAKLGWPLTPLRKMTIGIALSGLSWVIVGVMQLALDGGAKPTILWQVLPYSVLTLGEVFVSATGLEFAYSQAPLKMKGVLMSLFNLSVTVGGLWVLLVNASVKGPAVTQLITSNTGVSVIAFQMFFFAGFAFVAALLFAAYARRYVEQDFYRR